VLVILLIRAHSYLKSQGKGRLSAERRTWTFRKNLVAAAGSMAEVEVGEGNGEEVGAENGEEVDRSQLLAHFQVRIVSYNCTRSSLERWYGTVI